MQAFVRRSFGSADRLHLARLDRPAPGPGEVLVRVRATSVQPYDWHHLRGEPYVARLMGGGPGLRRPQLTVLGGDLAGEVAAVGRGVTGFTPGDEVYAMVPGGGFGQYAVVPAGELAPKPANLSLAEAAAVPLAGLTALLAVRDAGRVAAGHRVLVTGASGGVGTFAVQLAHAFGAEVTGVCSGRNAELVRSLGAARVIDHTTTDFTRAGGRYDVLIDIAGTRSVWACRRVLPPGGTIVAVGGPGGRWLQPAGHVLAVLAAARPLRRRAALVDVVAAAARRREDLATLTGLIEGGRVRPVIDRVYPFADLPEAVRYQERGRPAGKVVVEL